MTEPVIESDAIFSSCREYRYSLWRFWNLEKPKIAFLCLNPSTADEVDNDPTVARCIRYARDWGFGGYFMLNIFAFRATDPKVMKKRRDPVGPGNDKTLGEAHTFCDAIVCGWGNHGSHLDRGEHVKSLMQGPLYCLKTTKPGAPWHPLYLSASLKPLMFKPPETNREAFDRMLERVQSGETLLADELAKSEHSFKRHDNGTTGND